MTDDQIENLASEFDQLHSFYNGWYFIYDYPGTFVYYKQFGPYWMDVFFTPDWNDEGMVDMYSDVEGNDLIHMHQAYEGDIIEPEELFHAVKPLLDAMDGWTVSQILDVVGLPTETAGRREGSRKDWSPRRGKLNP